MKEMKSMRSDITKRLDTIDKKVEGVQKNIRQIKTDHNELKGKVNALYDENRLLLDGMEGQSRRNNIIVRGIPEKTDGRESWEDCEQALRESLVTKLGMARERADKMPIKRAHRLHKSAGRPAGTARDVIVNLSYWKDKDTILSCARRLKLEHMFFLEDFSDSVKTARAKLKDLLGKARQLELKSYLSYDKLLVMDAENRRNMYVYDESSDSVKALRASFKDGLLEENEADPTNDSNDGSNEETASSQDSDT